MKTLSSLELARCIRILDEFWTLRGCVKLDSSVNKLGAATFHPEMLRRVITFNCCKLCYVQPTFRPYDGDYGLSFSLQRYFQYQVVIKPFCGLAGGLFLESVRALGYLPALHRLVLRRSDWESSSLCAWGVGWECVLNSIEVAQITLFRQVCGVRCALPVLEIAYGLERLACALLPSRFVVTECELGFNYYNLDCLRVVSSLLIFCLLERELRQLALLKFFGVYYPVYDGFLHLVCVYNQLVARVKLKRKVLRVLLLRLQRLTRVVVSVLMRQSNGLV
ncbi:glycine--tRNA ligase subunit alpha [Candidatus Hodgkinia cicadicola]